MPGKFPGALLTMFRTWRMISRVLLIAVFGVPAAIAAQPPSAKDPAPLKVVATIKPVHSLAAGVMAGVGEPLLLIAGAGSEHSYALRPSQSRALQEAELIFWIGPELETFLVKPFQTLASNARIVMLSQAGNITLLPLRRPGVMDAEELPRGGNGGSLPVPHAAADMHIWLDPRNAAAMVDAIASSLATADPPHAATYLSNGAAMKVRLMALEREIVSGLEHLPNRGGFIVFHDAYRYFEQRFDLHPVAVISIDPHRAPGAARIRAIKDRIDAEGAVCIFTEPQFEPKIVQRLVEGTNTRTGVLDPMGAAFPDGDGLYFALLADMARSLRSCILNEG